MQTIGVTDLTITYHRPAVKNRMVWGDVPTAKLASLGPNASTEATLDGSPGSGKELPLAPNGHVWRAGANEATKFVVSDDVLINGQKLAAGAYSLHAIPGSAEWTLIFNKVADQWGSFRYDAKQDALRVKVKPEAAPMQEQLAYEIPSTTPNSARIVLRWEKVAVPFTVEVPNVDALVRTKVDAEVAANPADWQIPLTVGNAYANDDKLEDAMKWTEQSIKVKETFQNLAAKAQLLFAMGKKDEALAVADKAIARGKADGADTTRFEKRVADLKAGKM
jgi:tetratricopeptide (TPR) repeat protein